MQRPMMRTLWLSSILLATATTIASAQEPAARDSARDVAHTDSVSAALVYHNWFVSLLRK